MNPKVDVYIENSKNWQVPLKQLRRIILECQLTEELKWDCPCYTYKKSNVIILGGFKEYCSLSFFKGALLSDTIEILVAPGENSQSVRMFKFKKVDEIIELEPVIKAYIYEAIEVEKAGLKVVKKSNSELVLVSELQNKLNENPELKIAFEALTPGRKRAYNIHFSEAKQSSTRTSRIENCIPRILNGKGFNDCICGLSKRMPNCDGSHKSLSK